MDYSKAKNILIILLVMADVWLGWSYFSGRQDEEARRIAAAGDTALYVRELGVELDAEIPTDIRRMPVLYVSIERGREAQSYEGCSVEISGGSGNLKAVPENSGGAGADVMPASRALHKLVGSLGEGELSGMRISSIELVYWVDRSDFGSATGEDTALPAWKIATDRGPYYIEAYAN